MKKIEYFEPRSIEEAAQILADTRGFVLAGGTDLLVRMRRRLWDIRTIVNIKKIPAIAEIAVTDGHLSIGCLSTLSQIQSDALVQKHFPLLPRVIAQMASWQVRNIATMAGNICNASPAADTALPLLCLDAEVVVNGSRSIPIANFFTGPGKTALSPGELVTSIRIPLKASAYKTSFHRLGIRQGLDIAIAAVCVSVSPDLKEFRIALGSVAPIPMRATRAEKASSGKHEVAATECSPIDDFRASKWYRTEMIKVLTKRCLDEIQLQSK